MTFARAPYHVVGIAAGLGSALWFNGIAPPIGLTAISAGASTIIQAFAVVTTAAVAMLATAIGGLIASDWQADVQSRQDWAQLGLSPAELNLPVDPRPAWAIDPRYLAPTDSEAMQQILRAHRIARPNVSGGIPIITASAELSSAQTGPDQGSDTRELPAARTSDQILRQLAGANSASARTVVPSRQSKPRTKRAALRSRLVVNANGWPHWLAREARIPVPHTADIIVLSSSQDDEAQPPRDASLATNRSESTAPPSCRGPPHVVRLRSRFAATTSAQRSVEHAAHVSPAADPTVRDDLGQPIPVCTAELEVIEAYLGRLLQDLLASSTGKPDSEKT